jgi:type I restriction enzyme S subunit
MSSRLGFKLTKIGWIPEDWEVKHITDLCEVYSGLTYKPNNISELGILVLRASNIKDWRIVLEDNVYVNLELPSNVITKNGDILVCVRNGSKDLIGKCVLIDNKVEGSAFGAFMMVLRSKSNPLIFYYFQSNIVQTQIQKRLGATINQITKKDLSEFLIPFPKLVTEQHAIATVLSDVDKLIESLDELIEKKQAIKKATMHLLLTGKKRLPGFDTNNKFKKTEIGWIPEDWEVKKLKEVGKVVTGGTPPTKIKEYWGEDFIWITPTDISDKKIIFQSERQITKKALELIGDLTAGSVLVTCIASIGKNAILGKRGGCNQQINAVIPSNGYNSEFLYYLFENSKSYLQGFSAITATAIIPKSLFENIPFHFPKLPEQQAIAQVLSDMDCEIEALKARRDKLKQLKQGMMQVLLTGKIRLVETSKEAEV